MRNIAVRLVQVGKQATQACKRIPLDRIFDELRDCFSGIDEEFRRVCSVTKGYFGFGIGMHTVGSTQCRLLPTQRTYMRRTSSFRRRC